MPLSLKDSCIFRWMFRLFKYFAIFIISAILLVSLILVFLPTAVSTDTSKKYIETQISNVLDRPVSIDRLDWSWKDGIIINKLEIPDSPHFSENPMIFLEHVKLKLNIKRLLHREVNLELLLTNLDVHIIKNSSGTLNIATLGGKNIKEETPLALLKKKEIDKKKKNPFELPLDVSADIRLSGINLSYDDQAKSEKYSVKDLEIKLEAPSVKTSPINLAIEMDVQVNDQVISRSTFSASVKTLFDGNGALNIDGLIAGLDANLPGIVANVRADMEASELKSEIRVDLASLMDVAVPLIPGFPSPSDIKGAIVLTAATGTKPEDPLAFDAILSVLDLEVSGKVINGKSIGPGNLSVHLNGVMDLQAEKLDLTIGEIHILENSHITASGRVEQIKQDNKEIHLAISPLYLDLNEIIAFVHPFIPSSIELDNQAKLSEISLKKLQLEGMIPKGRANVLLDDLNIHLPNVILKDEANDKSVLQVSGARLNLEKLTAKLVDLFPESAALKLSLAVDELLNVNASNAISVSGIRLDHLTADAINIQKAGQSKLGIIGSVSLDNQLAIKQILLPDLIKIQDLDQSLMVRSDLRPDGYIQGSLDHLDITTKNISVLKKDVGPVQSGLEIRMSLEKLLIKKLDPFNLDIKNFFASMNLENAVSIKLNASAVDTANTSFSADIKINSDLGGLIEKIPSRLRARISGKGNLNITVNAVGHRPDDKALAALKKLQFKNNLGFIDQAKLGIMLDNGSLEIPQPNKSNITIGSITADPLLAYELNGATGKGNLACSIMAGAMKGLPALNPDAPILAEFSLTGSHKFAQSIELHQSFVVLPGGIEESFKVSVDGLDRMITRSPLPELPIWLSEVGAQISAKVNIPNCRAFKELGLPGLSEKDINGQINAGLKFHLIPDQSIDGGFTLSINDMNIGIPDTFTAQKVHANIDFSKSYQIQAADRQALFSDTSGLSRNVINSAWNAVSITKNSDISSHIRLVHERMNPDPAISFQKADISAGPFPIAIGESMMMLNLRNGLPSLDFFQFNLLGGTIIGSIDLHKEQKKFYVNTAVTFSGINTAEFFPQAFSKNDHSEADISGLLYADFPVTDQLQNVLENTDIRIEFTRIGSRALERMLYALDPYENNEAIVSQRRLLKAGSPKQIRLTIKDGFLSLRGKVVVQGISISLPAIRRLNIALIPGLERFQDKLSGLKPMILILQKISAERIVINKQTNAITFE